jgi:hypothetical protein
MKRFSPYGNPMVAQGAKLTLAQLKALNVNQALPYIEEFILSDDSSWYYNPVSVLAGDDLFVVAPNNSQPGRYLRMPGAVCDLRMAIGFATADAAVLATLPANSQFLVVRGLWETTSDWTGGTSSAIGLSSSQAPHNTKGDLLGGAAGDVAATLVAASGTIAGTIGADIAAGVLLKGGAAIRFDRITSAFTAGAGFGHLVGMLLKNPGA